MFYRFIFFSLLLFTFLSNASASDDIFAQGELYFENIGDIESIPLCCTTLAQDQHGFIWIGTQEGLVRYDGYRFRHFKYSAHTENSISDNFIKTISITTDGQLWIGTASQGISIFNPETESFKHISHQPGNPDSLSHNRINSFVFDQQGGAWIGTNNGLDYLDPFSGKITHYQQKISNDKATIDNKINILLMDQSGTLWIGTDRGLNQLVQGTHYFDLFQTGNELFDNILHHPIRSLLTASDGKIWVGTNSHGTFWINPVNNTINRSVKSNPLTEKLNRSWVQSIVQAQSGEIWIGAFGQGIFILNPENGEIIRHIQHDSAISKSINMDNIGSLLVDKSGLIWIATWGGGLNRFNPHNDAFLTIRHSPNKPASLSHSDIGAILELDNGHLWVGSHGNGIDIFNPNEGVIGGFRADPKLPGALSGGIITAIAQTPDKTIWVGTQRSGLNRYNPQSQSFTKYSTDNGLSSNNIRYILADQNELLWIATDSGLNLFDPITETFRQFAHFKNSKDLLPGKTITTLSLEKDNSLWIGTTDGLFYLPASQEKIIHFSHQQDQDHTISSNSISGLLIDSKNQLWVDTKQGLNRLLKLDQQNAVAEFEPVSALAGSPGLYLGGNLLEDKQGRIWTQWYMLEPEKLQLHKLTRAEGVDIGTAWVSSYTKTRQGIMLFGGTEGILMVKPELFKPWSFQPSLLISELKIDGTNVSSRNSGILKLSPSVKNFSVEFSSQDYSAAEKNRFAYRLEGYDNYWIETDSENRRANYTNLDPGKYTFHLKGSNRNAQWSKHEFSLNIIQLSAWYQTIWFKLVIVFLIMALVYLIIKLRLRQLKFQKQQLQNKIDERTRELEQALSNLEKISLSDHLTGVHNRRFLNQFIIQDLAKLQRDYHDQNTEFQSSFSFILIDIDNFKNINDQFGHDAGDKVLIQFADVLTKKCRESDWVIRWGGEEFLIVGRFTKQARLHEQAERIRKKIRSKVFKLGNNQQVNLTCSMGISTFPFIKNDFNALSWEQTLKLADLALYTAKKNDKNIWISLFENNISNSSLFYEQVQDDLTSQIENSAISFECSGDNKKIKFL